MSSAKSNSSDENEGKFTAGGYELDRGESRRARMLYDYDATNDDELSVNASSVSWEGGRGGGGRERGREGEEEGEGGGREGEGGRRER